MIRAVWNGTNSLRRRGAGTGGKQPPFTPESLHREHLIGRPRHYAEGSGPLRNVVVDGPYGQRTALPPAQILARRIKNHILRSGGVTVEGESRVSGAPGCG